MQTYQNLSQRQHHKKIRLLSSKDETIQVVPEQTKSKTHGIQCRKLAYNSERYQMSFYYQFTHQLIKSRP